MEILRERCAGLDVHKKNVKACFFWVLTQKNVEGKLEEVDPTQEGKDHAKDPTNLYERI